VGDHQNFGGNEEFLRSRGVELVLLSDPACVAMMSRFIAENPALWNEDIAE
jgi:creatinine deaminase